MLWIGALFWLVCLPQYERVTLLLWILPSTQQHSSHWYHICISVWTLAICVISLHVWDKSKITGTADLKKEMSSSLYTLNRCYQVHSCPEAGDLPYLWLLHSLEKKSSDGDKKYSGKNKASGSSYDFRKVNQTPSAHSYHHPHNSSQSNKTKA